MSRSSAVHPSRWLPVIVCVVGFGVGGLVACGAGNPDRAELTDALVTSGVPEAVARCTAEALIDSLSDDELEQLVSRGPGGAPRDDATENGEPADRLRDALSTCRDDLPAETVPVEAPEAETSTVPPTSGPVFDTVPPDTEG